LPANLTKADALAIGFIGWGSCHLSKPPEKFGEGMAALGRFLGIPMIESEMNALGKRLGLLEE